MRSSEFSAKKKRSPSINMGNYFARVEKAGRAVEKRTANWERIWEFVAIPNFGPPAYYKAEIAATPWACFFQKEMQRTTFLVVGLPLVGVFLLQPWGCHPPGNLWPRTCHSFVLGMVTTQARGVCGIGMTKFFGIS